MRVPVEIRNAAAAVAVTTLPLYSALTSTGKGIQILLQNYFGTVKWISSCSKKLLCVVCVCVCVRSACVGIHKRDEDDKTDLSITKGINVKNMSSAPTHIHTYDNNRFK